MTFRGAFAKRATSALTLAMALALTASAVGCGRGDYGANSREHALEIRWQGNLAAMELAVACSEARSSEAATRTDLLTTEQTEKNINRLIAQFRERHQGYLDLLATEGLDVEGLIDIPEKFAVEILTASTYRIDNLHRDKLLAEKILEEHLNKHGRGVHQPIFPKFLTQEENRLVDRAWDTFGSYFDSPLVALVKFNDDLVQTIQAEREYYQTLMDLYSEKIVIP